jgi:uncharacterized membrane protein
MGFRLTTDRATGAPQQTAGEPLPPRRMLHPLMVGLLTLLVAAGYSAFALARFHTFQTASYDLVIFDQAVRSYAHLHPGISIMKGVHNGFGPDFSVLGDHWSPILAVLAPLYWVSNSPANLLVAQAVLFALAIPPLWIFTRRAFGGGRKATAAAYLVSVAYALSWPIASALAFDFHEVAFAPVLTAVALERIQAGRLRTALLALAGLLLVKEDMGFLVAGIGVYLILSRPRTLPKQWLVGAALIVAGVADGLIATYVLIPAMGGRADYYWAYQALGSNGPQAIAHILAHPASSLQLAITPRVKLDTMLWLLAAFCFLSLRSPLVLATIPLLAERMLDTKFPNWWVTGFQYNAYLVIVLAMAAVDGAARLDRDWLRVRQRIAARRAPADAAAAGDVPADAALAGGAPADGTGGAGGDRAPAGAAPAASRARARAGGTVALGCAVAMAAMAVALVPRFAFGPALHPSFYHRTRLMNAAAAADARVPSGVTVQAPGNLGPQLSARDTVLLFDGDGETPRFSPWIVADVRRQVFTFHSVQAQRQRVALLERHGYQVVFRRAGYVVLHRGAPGGGTRPGQAAR